MENVRFSGDGIRVIQYAANYDFSNEKPGGKVLTEDELSWSVLFKPNSMRNICVRELKIGSNEKRKRLSTVIELCFEYEGLPESKDSTRFMIREEGEISEHDEEVAGEETGYVLFRANSSAW